MSTSDQPDTPPLTRRRLREIRNTGSTPVIQPDGEGAAEQVPVAPPAPAPLARAAEPAPIAPAPVAPVDLGVSPLTRRQARQQERIRTASVPVISPDVAAAHSPAPVVITSAPAAQPVEAAPEQSFDDVVAVDEPETDDVAELFTPAADDGEPARLVDEAIEERAEGAAPAQLNPALGSDLLLGDTPQAPLPASFDQLIARNASATGSISAPNALILSQTPTGAPLVGPITATGEVIITGTFDLPEGLGSIGHAPGVADGKDVDVALIDGELPAASSPTPIAASAAISTARNAGEEIIRPPAPDKGGRLTLALVITVGVLALVVAGALIFAVATGRI